MLDTQVTIVGAGPTGLMLGCLLLHKGINCIIIEKSDVISSETRGLMIHSKSLEILESINCLPEILDVGEKIKYLSFHIINKRIFKFNFENLNITYPFYVILPQPEIEKILEKKFLSLGGQLYRGQKFLELKQQENLVSITEGLYGNKKLRSDYLVACDGASSSVRNFLQIPFDGITYDMDYILAEGILTRPPPRNEAAMYITSKGSLSVLPFGNNRFRVAGPSIRKISLEGDKKIPVDTFNEILKEMELFELLNMQNHERVTYYRVNERIVPNLRFGNVFFAGDAAHIHSPAGGQAMGVGFQDAYSLSHKLFKILKKEASLSVLDTYHSERYPSIKKAIDTTNFSQFIKSMKESENEEAIQMVYAKGIQLIQNLSQICCSEKIKS